MSATLTNEAASAAEQSGLPRGTLLFLLLTIFMTAMGFTVVTPVMPFIVLQYAGAPNNLPVLVGWLTASYAICQFVAAPGLGVLSDRFGRRPLLLICLLGSAAGYLLFGIGGALWVLFLGRIIDGLTGGNISILFAYIGDVAKPAERGKLFGQIGGIAGLGTIVGPVLGGFAASLGYTAPLYLAAAIVLANTIWGYFAMPESLQQKHRTTQVNLGDLNPLKQMGAIFGIARLRWLLVTSLCYYFPFAMFVTELAVLAVDKLAWTPAYIGLILLMVGGIDLVMQGFLSGKLIPRFGETRLIIAGLICEAAGYVLIGTIALVPQPALMLVGILCFAFGAGLLEPALSALTSMAASQREQGVVQGGSQALRSLTQIAGPLLAGFLYIQLGGESPFWLGAAIMLLGIISILLAAPHLAAHLTAPESLPAKG